MALKNWLEFVEVVWVPGRPAVDDSMLIWLPSRTGVHLDKSVSASWSWFHAVVKVPTGWLHWEGWYTCGVLVLRPEGRSAMLADFLRTRLLAS